MTSLVTFGRRAPANPADIKPSAEKHNITSLIAASAVFKGDLLLKESVHVCGTIIGSVQIEGSGVLFSLREGGRVEGKIEADMVVVAGTVIGDVRARIVRLMPTARIDGNIFYDRILVSDGATINTRCMESIRDLVQEKPVPAQASATGAVVDIEQRLKASSSSFAP